MEIAEMSKIMEVKCSRLVLENQTVF